MEETHRGYGRNGHLPEMDENRIKHTFCQKKMKLDMIFRIFMVSYKRALYEYKEWW